MFGKKCTSVIFLSEMAFCSIPALSGLAIHQPEHETGIKYQFKKYLK
jgi:hypothetical protein